MASPYRADHVGSLLRPPELLAAREARSRGSITTEQLHEAEDQAVLKALDLQREVGIDIFTDGEYRRAAWSAVIRESVEGLVPDADPPTRRILGAWQGPHSDVANSTIQAMGALVAGGKLRQTRRLTGDAAAFLKRHTPGPWKMTMPGPVSAAGQLFKPGVTDKFYPTRQEFVDEIAGMLRREIEALIEDGASYIQLDSLHYVERVADTTITPQSMYRIEHGKHDVVLTTLGKILAAMGYSYGDLVAG